MSKKNNMPKIDLSFLCIINCQTHINGDGENLSILTKTTWTKC